MYVLVTDGAYSSLRNQGGMSLVFLKDNKLIAEYSKTVKNCTNNQMELGAIIAGFSFIKNYIDHLLVISDSMYCIGIITMNWKRKKNQLLWQKFDEEYERVKQLCPNIEFKHVKGHSGDYWNTYVDKLAVKASQSL